MNRRSMLFGIGAASVAGVAAPAVGAPVVGAPSRVTAPQAFEVRSSDGTTLVGDTVGDPEAPEILFVHGLRQSRLSWIRQFDDPSLAGFRKVRFDLRGHGDSDKPASPESYAYASRWADDIAAVIEAAKLRKPVLVGWSMGGYVTGAYLQKYGETTIAGVNLVDAVPNVSAELLTPLALHYGVSTSSHDLAVRSSETAEFLLACFNRPPVGADLEQMLVVNGMTSRAVNDGFTHSTTPNLESVFAKSTKPLLLTHGVHDRLVKLAMSERIKKLRPDAQLSLYRESGHSPFYEEPERFNGELGAFVSSVVSKTA